MSMTYRVHVHIRSKSRNLSRNGDQEKDKSYLIQITCMHYRII